MADNFCGLKSLALIGASRVLAKLLFFTTRIGEVVKLDEFFLPNVSIRVTVRAPPPPVPADV